MRYVSNLHATYCDKYGNGH